MSRRSWLRRALRVAVILGLSAVFVALLALVFLRTPLGQASARAWLEDWGSRATGGTLRLGRLDLAPWRGEASASAVSLTLPAATLELQQATLEWSPRSGPHVALVRPRIVVRDTGVATPTPATGLAAQPWRLLERLDRAEVIDGRLELRDANGAPWLVLGRFDLEMASGSGRAALRVEGARLGSPEGWLRLEPASAEAELSLAAGTLSIERARIIAGSSGVDLSGRLERVLPVSASVSAHASVDGPLVAALVPGADLEGRIEASADLQVANDLVRGTLEAGSRALTLDRVGPWSFTGRGHFDGARLVLDTLVGAGFGGRIEASGPLALSSSARTELRVRANGLDSAALARALAGVDVPLSARAGGSLLWTAQGWDVPSSRGEGRITLSAGAGPGLRPAGEVVVRMRGLELAIPEARVESRGAHATASAQIDPGGAIRGGWTAELPLAAVRELLADVGSSVRVPDIDGRLVAQGDVAGFISELRGTGSVRGEGVSAAAEPLGLDAELRYQQGLLSLEPLVLRSGSGQATLAGDVPLAAGGEWDLAGEVGALETRPLQKVLGVPGYGSATGTIRLTGPRDDPMGHLSLRAKTELPRPAGSPVAVVDDVVVELEAASAGRRVGVERLVAELAGGRVSGKGSYDPASGALEAMLEVEGVAWERLPLIPAPARGLSGVLAGRMALSGTVQEPSGDLALSLAGGAIDGAPLPPVSFTARADGRELRVEGAAEEVFLRGRGPLAGDWPLQVEVDAARLPLQALAAASARGREMQATLSASGTLALSLPLREPSRFAYSTSNLAATGRVGRLEWTLTPFALRGDRDSASIEGLRLASGDASLFVNGRIALAAGSPLALRIEGDLDLGALDPALPGRALDGSGRISVSVAGTREAPQLSGTLHLAGVGGTFEGARLRDLELSGRFVEQALEVDSLTAELLGGKVTARGRVPILPLPGAERAKCSFELRDVDLARLDRERGETAEAPALLVSLEGEVEASALSLDGLAARGRLTRLEPRSVEGGLALVEPASFTLESRRFALAPLRLSGSFGQVEARAEAELAAQGPHGSVSVAGGLDLSALSALLPDTSLAGPARIDARIVRGQGAWRLEGGVTVDRARLSLDTLNFALSELTGELRLEGDRVALEATGVAGDGRIRAKGGMRLGPALLGPVDVTLEAERMPVQYPPGYRGRASGSLRLSGEPGGYRLAGAVSMSQGYYTAEVDAKSRSLGRLDWQLAALEGGALTDRIALDVGVRLAEPLRVRNQTLRLDVEGGVSVSGTLAQPTAGGQLTLREGGELTLGRARLRVSQGRVELNGYPAGTPNVDFAGVTRVGGVLLEVRARGALDNMELTLSSDRSDLSQTDLATLLLTGRTAAAAASQSGVVVAEQLAVALGGVLQKGVGEALLIDVSPDRSLLTDDTDPTQRFNVGTRVTQNVTVIYSAALDGTEKRWILELNPAGGRFRLRAISEEDNSLSLEATDRFSFDLWNRGGTPPREVDRLVAVRFEGDLKIPQDELRGAAKLKTGRRSSGLQREQAADRVRERLVRAGYRSASVDAVTQPERGGVALVLRVEAGPLVPIEWEGDDPGKDVREGALRAWPAVALPEFAAAQVARSALARLQAEGYYAARVSPQVTPGAGRAEVRFDVARGPLGKGVDVEFEGNSVLGDAALAAKLPRPGSLEFFEALDPRSARITNDVRLAYAGVGYVRARVGAPRTAFDAASGRLRVTIPVRERGASLVAGVELPAEAAQASGLELRLEQGQPFDLAAYVADRDAISAWYLANGWMEAQVRGVIEARGPAVSVRYLADPGPRPRVAEIRVDQAGRTREALIRRSLSVREGDFVRPALLADSRERLSEIGVFRSVDVRAEPRADDPGLRDVVVGLVDKPDVQVEYGLRYTTSGEGGGAGAAPSSPSGARLQLAGAVELSNPFGFGVKTRAYAFGTTSRQTWGVNLDAATFVGRRLRTQLFVFDDSDEDIQISGLASHVKGTTLQQTRVLLRDRHSRRWHDRLRLQWGYTFKDIEYVDLERSDQVLQGDRGFVSLALIGDERDSLTDPTRGLFWTATTELARTSLGSDVDYARLYGQLFAYLPLGPLVWAQGYRVGSVPGRDPLLLIENRFRAGGPTTVRGYEQNALGPTTAEGDSLGGQAVAVLNQELRFPIFRSLKGGVFWDAGNVWPTSGGLHFGDLRHSVGAGLRYIFPFGPVRIEYAWILDRRDGEPVGRVVFGLGHAF